MKKVLLATLGESPAVVTEAIDRLRADGVSVDIVTLLTTKDTDTQNALSLLSKHIPRYYGEKVEFHGDRVANAFYDIDTEKAVMEFMDYACSALRDYRKKGWEVYACIAGGRKAMSALLCLAVQFYGANSLFHVLIEDPEIEKGGHISGLQNLSDVEQDRRLHPPVEQIKLVRLPFIGLFPWLSQILGGLKGNLMSREIEDLLERNDLWRAGQITELGELVLHVLENVESLPDPRGGECEINLGGCLKSSCG